LRAEVSDEQLRRKANRTGLSSEWGRKNASVRLPAARTVPTNKRAVIGRSFTDPRLADVDGGARAKPASAA
jgi:hypothetical protein